MHPSGCCFSSSIAEQRSLWSLTCGIDLTSVGICVCSHVGSFYNQRRGPQGRGVPGWCSSCSKADVYSRSGDMSPEWAISESKGSGVEDRKSQYFFLHQKSWRLGWKLVSTLETGFVPSYNCTTIKLSCPRTALFLLSNPWDSPPQPPSDNPLCTPAWR